MSDTEDLRVEDPAPAAPAVHAYKVIPLRIDEQGMPTLWGKQHVLPAKVYDRKTAMKFAANEAQQLSTSSVAELIFAVVTPQGRCFAVLAGGTGKPVRALIALRTKRALATLMPNEIVSRRRTSRPLVGAKPSAKPGRRRTSRGRS